jgi:murein DD-endopeptidase MepM/ murein hydrolase activator NlpD
LPLAVKAKITTRFALLRKAKTYQYFHKGVDFSIPTGTPVKAMNSGKIIFAKSGLNVYGVAMVVDHGQGVTSCYFHLNKLLKKEGETVEKGEIIAESGATGWATGPHLHFGLYLQGEAVDPFWWIKFAK